MKPCMDPAEAAEWAHWNATLPASQRAADPCEDCTVRFAVEMRLAGRCDSWPSTPVGGRPWNRTPDERQSARRAQWRAYKARQRARATA